MPNNNLEIKITTLADLSGARATQQALNDLARLAGQVATAAGAAVGQQTGTTRAASALAAEAGRAADQVGRFAANVNQQFTGAGQAAGETRERLAGTSREAENLFSTLKAGFSIDIGHRIAEGILEIPAAFREALSEGIRFNAQMESLSISLAGSFRSAEPAKFLNFGQAKTAAVAAMEQIRVKANELGQDFERLAHITSIAVPSLAEAGVRGIDKQLEVVVLLNQLAQSKGIQGFQAQRDILAIIQGRGERTILGKEITNTGVTNASVKEAKEQGTLYELLTTKLASYAEAGQAASNTFTAGLTRLRNEWLQTAGAFAQPVFDELKIAYTELASELAKPGAREALRSLGYDVASIAKTGAGLVEWTIKNSGVLVPLGKTVTEVSIALGVLKLAQTAVAAGRWVAGWIAETLAIGAHTKALADDTIVTEANAAAKATNARAGAAGVAGGGGSRVGMAAIGISSAIVGFQTGRAIREGYTQEQRDAQEVVDSGRVIQGEFDRIDAIRQQVQEAHNLEEQQEANKKLGEEITAVQERITEAKRKDTPASQANLPILSQQLHSLERIQASFTEIAGTRQHTQSREEKIGDELDRQKKAAEELAATLKQVDKVTGEIGAHAEQDRFNKLSPEGQVADLQRQRASVVQKLSASSINTLPLAEGQREQNLDTYMAQANRPMAKDGDAEVQKQRREFLDLVRQLQEIQERQEKVQASINQKQAKSALDQAKEVTKTLSEVPKTVVDNAKEAADAARQRKEALDDEREKLSILRAQAMGNADEAALLEKQRDIRREIKGLMADGVSYEEALEQATEEANLAQQARDVQFKKDHAHDHDNEAPWLSFRPDETSAQYRARTGGVDGRAKDTDPAGWVHSGSLNDARSNNSFFHDASPSLTSSAGAFLAGAPSAAVALTGQSTAGGLLASRSFSFPDEPGPSTAAAHLVPVGSRLAAVSPAASASAGSVAGTGTASADNSLSAAANRAATATEGAKGAGDKAAGSSQSAATSLERLATAADGVKSAFDKVDGGLKTLERRVASVESKLNTLRSGD